MWPIPRLHKDLELNELLDTYETKEDEVDYKEILFIGLDPQLHIYKQEAVWRTPDKNKSLVRMVEEYYINNPTSHIKNLTGNWYEVKSTVRLNKFSHQSHGNISFNITRERTK